jgi:ATP-dependent DNA ligase
MPAEYKFTKNKRSIIYTFDDDAFKVLPELIHQGLKGESITWQIKVKGNRYYQSSGMVGGVITEYPPITCYGKNIGKKNETSPHEQAMLEAISKWNRKHDSMLQNKVKDNKFIIYLPMLALNYETRKHNIVFPCAASRKMDGIRCIAQVYNDDIFLTTRYGKEIHYLDKIKYEVSVLLRKHKDLILDGELYSHTLPFFAISGATKKKKEPSEYDELISYWVFDVIDPKNTDQGYQNRIELLKKLGSEFVYEYIHFVFYDKSNNEDELMQYHDKYLLEGFEGLIIRNLQSDYKFGKRVSSLQKYKNFDDAEFKVIDAIEGQGTEKGAVVFVCITESGNRFNVRPRGTVDKRRWQYKNKHIYIGKLLTIRFQKGVIDDGSDIPRFCRGIKFDEITEKSEPIEFRDYE